MPDLQQLIILAFALVPGFVAAETQGFVALRRTTPSSDKVLLAVAYSAGLYLLTTLGGWGPQGANSFRLLLAGDISAILNQELLVRYLVLLAIGVLLGIVVGRSLASGRLRSLIAAVSGRNVIASTWVEFFHDRPGAGFWMELRDGRRIAGIVTAASDSGAERFVVLRWPKWVAADGSVVPMKLEALLVDADECALTGEIPKSDLVGKAGGS